MTHALRQPILMFGLGQNGCDWKPAATTTLIGVLDATAANAEFVKRCNWAGKNHLWAVPWSTDDGEDAPDDAYAATGTTIHANTRRTGLFCPHRFFEPAVVDGKWSFGSGTYAIANASKVAFYRLGLTPTGQCVSGGNIWDVGEGSAPYRDPYLWNVNEQPPYFRETHLYAEITTTDYSTTATSRESVQIVYPYSATITFDYLTVGGSNNFKIDLPSGETRPDYATADSSYLGSSSGIKSARSVAYGADATSVSGTTCYLVEFPSFNFSWYMYNGTQRRYCESAYFDGATLTLEGSTTSVAATTPTITRYYRDGLKLNNVFTGRLVMRLKAHEIVDWRVLGSLESVPTADVSLNRSGQYTYSETYLTQFASAATTAIENAFASAVAKIGAETTVKICQAANYNAVRTTSTPYATDPIAEELKRNANLR